MGTITTNEEGRGGYYLDPGIYYAKETGDEYGRFEDEYWMVDESVQKVEIVGVPLFFLTKEPLGNSTAALLMILTMLPAFLLALSEMNGQHLAGIIRNMVRVLFLRPKERPYRTNNFYAVLERQDNLDKEVYRIVHPSQKARTEKSGAGRYLKGKAHR